MGRADRAQFSTATGDADAAGQRRTVMKKHLYQCIQFTALIFIGINLAELWPNPAYQSAWWKVMLCAVIAMYFGGKAENEK